MTLNKAAKREMRDRMQRRGKSFIATRRIANPNLDLTSTTYESTQANFQVEPVAFPNKKHLDFQPKT